MITLTFSAGDTVTRLQTLQSHLTDLSTPLAASRDIMLASVQANFAQGGRPTPWTPLAAPRTGIVPLSGRGVLRSSIVPALTLNSVELSTALPYAAVQRYGATIQVPEIVPRRARALRWIGRDGRAVFARRVRAHAVTIPARPFLLFQEEDMAAITQLFRVHLLQGV